MGMLVLSRRVDETILIGSDIEVTVLEIETSGRVRLGIKAPKELAVDRKEVRAMKEVQGERNSRRRPK